MNIFIKTVGKKIPKKIFTFLMLISSSVYAAPSRPPGMPDGGCWADPMNNLIISLGTSSFYSNKEGATASIGFSTTPSYYPGWCYSESGARSASIFSADMGVKTPGKEAKYYQLSEDVDFRISITFPRGLLLSPPFWDKNLGANMGPEGTGVTELTGATVGNIGWVYFRLRRTLIGGAFFVPGGVELARLYRYVYTGKIPTIPIYRLVTEQTVIPVPVECRINEGKTIDVNFGLIQSSLITGSALSSVYNEKRQLQYKCNTTLTQDIKVVLAAESAPFGDAIKTTNPDIGVVMLYNNRPVKPNQSFNTRLVNGLGGDNVSFSVVGSGNKPATGDFSGSATLIISSL